MTEPESDPTGAHVNEAPRSESPPNAAPALALAAVVRIDRWLWAARLFKTRSQASRACAAGQVKCNGDVVKSAKLVRPGDEIEALTPGGPRIVGVLATAEKRGPAPVARALYDDRTPPPPPREEEFAIRPRGAGRPVKRERRRLLRLRGR